MMSDSVTTSPVETSTNTTQSAPQNPIFSWTGSNIVLVFVYSGMIAVLIAIAVKRIVGRVNRSLKFFRKHIEHGSGAPKKLMAEIDFQLDRAAQFMYEPKLLQPDEASSIDENNPDYYRMKTVDEISDLDKAFKDLNEELQRPMGKDVCQHLFDVKSHSSGCLKSVRTSHLHSISDLYLQARYGAESYGVNDYNRFKELSNEIITVLRQRTIPKKNKDKMKTRSNASTKKEKTSKAKNKPSTSRVTTSFINETRPHASKSSRDKSVTDTSPLL